MTRRKHLEDDLHLAVAQFLNVALPKDSAWTTVEQGGKRDTLEAGRLKAKGVMAGWPDLEVVWRGRIHCIELKSPKGVLSDDQITMHLALKRAGALIAICRSVEAVEGTLRGWGLPLKATTGTTRGQGEAA